ncbi:hypothetical protein [Chryseobacterium sp.]|uniref:hypothetical protein n=1 Tax=Chryseobacterium sp. TaxID=1871047 RepID=UPI00289BFEA4|nr:hypothetical protein [Chryseobacterium sp.]
MAATILKTVSILAYLFIILMGTMTAIPLVIWLLFTAFDFGNLDQIFAVLGIFGILLNLVKWKNNVPPAILSFLMMLSPVISRIIQVPFEQFNYLLFQIPLAIFIIGYPVSIILTARRQKEKTA